MWQSMSHDIRARAATVDRTDMRSARWPFDDMLAAYHGGAERPQRCLVMGVLNVTPDSFSDGGRYLDRDSAVTHGMRWLKPAPTSSTSAANRLDQVHTDLGSRRAAAGDTGGPRIGGRGHSGQHRHHARRGGARVGIGGVQVVNDVSGGLADPAMAGAIAELGVPLVTMHWRAHSAVMQQHTRYVGDIVTAVGDELARRIDSLVAAGVRFERIVVDPGIGFAKNTAHNWVLLSRLPELSARLQRPVLVGASRKRFLRRATGASVLDAATTSVSALAALAGAKCVRVHDVAGNLAAVRVAENWAAHAVPEAAHPMV